MMDFKAYQSHLSKISARFNLMVFLVFGLLTANILLSVLVFQVWKHHTVEITPYFGDSGYLKSANHVDSNYLSLMSENFIYSRLNVTPETVEANHQRLLKFADSQIYPEMLRLLDSEEKVITSKKMSSVFEIIQIRTNPKDLTAEVTGVLKRYVGLRALKEDRLTYALRFNYNQGRLSILAFTHIKEKANA
ncbi:type IV conjugative transfer system protein TraE [Legionella quateirensis]|nr:type IV conjugative transfer system protein TraE [Legionella quateirensis]